MYELLLTVHVIAAIVWLGGSAIMHVIGRRALKRGDGAALAATSQEINLIASRLYPIAAIVLLIAGIGLVHETGYASFGDPWVVLGLAGWGASFLVGVAFYGPHDARLQRLVTESGPADPGVATNVRQTLLVNQVELLILFAVVVDMTVKPGL